MTEEHALISAFGTELAKLREGRGWSRSDLARHLRVSRTAVANWEENKAIPHAETRAKLSRLFGTDEKLGSSDFVVHSAREGLIGLRLQSILADASNECAKLLGMEPEEFSLSLKIEVRKI